MKHLLNKTHRAILAWHAIDHTHITTLRQALGNSKKEWEKAVVEYSKSHQMRWKGNLGLCHGTRARAAVVAPQ